jgi:hypothetical protein
VLEENGKGLLHAVAGDEALEVAERAPGQPKELAVRASGVLVDGPPHEGQEPGLPMLQTLAERRPGVLRGDGGPKEGGQRAQEPRPDEEIVHPDHERDDLGPRSHGPLPSGHTGTKRS